MITITQQDKKMLKLIQCKAKTNILLNYIRVALDGDKLEFQTSDMNEVWNWTRPLKDDETLQFPILIPKHVLKTKHDTRIEFNEYENESYIGLHIVDKIGVSIEQVPKADIEWPKFYPDVTDEPMVEKPEVIWKQELDFNVLNMLIPSLKKEKKPDYYGNLLSGLILTPKGLGATDGKRLAWHDNDYKVEHAFGFKLPLTWQKKTSQLADSLTTIRIKVRKKCTVTKDNKDGVFYEYYESTFVNAKDGGILDCMVKTEDLIAPNWMNAIPEEKPNDYVLRFGKSDIESLKEAVKRYQKVVFHLDGTMEYIGEYDCDKGPKRKLESGDVKEMIVVTIQLLLDALNIGVDEIKYEDGRCPVYGWAVNNVGVVIMPCRNEMVDKICAERAEKKRREEEQLNKEEEGQVA